VSHKSPSRERAAAAAPPRVNAPSAASLATLVALAAATALWSLFLWGELLRVRSGGGRPFCPLAAPETCLALWDTAFASGVQRLTGVPLPGWGLVWGLAAFVLPLFALTRRADGRSADAPLAAVRALAAGAVLVVFVLLAVIVAEGRFCPSCFTAHLLALAYAAIALVRWRRLALPGGRHGLALAAASLAGAYALLLYAGLRTPSATVTPGSEALAAAPGPTAAAPADSLSDSALRTLVASLDPGLRQTLSDSLLAYRNGADYGRPVARFTIGPPDAPVRITEFTDVRCDHCAALHRTLARLRERVSDQSMSVEPRQFPLDGECNPTISRRSDPVRCLAAQALICLEGRDGYLDYSGALFERQKTLTAEQVFSLASPYLPRPELSACIASPETARKLADDIRLASVYQPEGTPLVLINGRRAVSFPPFLLAIVLTRGAADAPAFASLPPADPAAQLF
jgi:uncharacterized membrane protein